MHLEPDILECEVKWTLGSITKNKAIGGNVISAELFQILKDDPVKMLYLICQQICKTQQWPQYWKKSVFIPISKKNNAKECASESRSVMSDSATPWTVACQDPLCPWNSPCRNTRVGSISLLQWIFPTQELNPGLLYCRQIFFII